MKANLLALIDWNRGIWVVQYRDPTGDMITEPTQFPAHTPSVVVCDQLLKDRPGHPVFAKLG